ncbi:MAG TPA: MmgE/PrpD family protein [Gaiellaceae bacterium]|jgi:2-methylcitrate dehydratase PrpD
MQRSLVKEELSGEVHGSARPIASALGDYVTRDNSFPAAVLDHARLAVLDTIGCIIGATRTVPGRRILMYTDLHGATGPTTTVGLATGRRAEDSALANGTLAHMLEFDDGHRPSDNHLGCVVVPAAFAMAEETGANLGQLLDSVVVGYDVMGRAGEATLLPRNRSAFHGTGTTGVFGAAAVAARMLGLDAAQTAHALGIAGTAAAGLRESSRTGPDCKPLHAGRAAQNGIAAATLASLGYEGPLTIFEGERGFCRAMCAEPRPALLLDALGERFSVREAGFKVHSTCGVLFNVIDAVLELRGRNDFDVRPPETITVGVPSWIAEEASFLRRRPSSPGEARFSIPFSVAAAIADGEVSPLQMQPEKLTDPKIAELEVRVQWEVDDEVDQIYLARKDESFFFYPASVTFERDGTAERVLSTNPRGYDPAIPLSQEEVATKFYSTVRGIVSDADASRVADFVLTASPDASLSSTMKVLTLS